MKKPILLLLTWLLLSPAISHADIQLILPTNVRVVAYNGQNSSDLSRLTLPDGNNQIALRFEGELGRGKDAEYVYSEVIVATFDAKDTDLSLNIPEIRSSHTLNRFNRDPQIKLTDATGKRVTCKMAVIKKEGFQIQRDYAAELVEFNRGDSAAAVASLKPAAVSWQPSPDSHPEVAEQMLHYWYQQADAETRSRFKQWLETK